MRDARTNAGVRGGPPGGEDLDAPLVRRAIEGDFGAFSALVERHRSRVYTLALRISSSEADAEEVTQGAFLSAMENLGSFRGDSRFGTWLYRIAANRALKAVRARQRRREEPMVGALDESFGSIPHPERVAPWTADPEKLAQRRETRGLLDSALGELDPNLRAIFLLRDIEGLSTEEAAEALGLTISNAKVRLMRARLALRERLTRVFGSEAEALAGLGHTH